MSANKTTDRYADYIPVNERLGQFYAEHKAGRILTFIVEHNIEAGFICMRAEVYRNPDDAQPAASGHAFEERSGGPAQRTSYIEVCETSAVGRALALLGFEVKRSIASREEMQKVERMSPPDIAPARPTRVTQLPNLPAHPKTSAETIEGHIMTALEVLGKTEDELNDWVARQFKWKGDWSDMSTDLLNKTYLTLQEKIDKQNEGAQ